MSNKPNKINNNKSPGSSPDMPDQRVKLITVHGTGAGDTSRFGDGWWQLESTFLTDLGQRLELDVNPDSGEVFPFQWEQGPNSEKQRRAAGTQLYQTMLHCEASGAQYTVVGHSHGGSVLYHALLQSVDHDTPLKNLKGWCTVGTPFLDYRPNTFLFQRLHGLGLAFYASGAISVFLGFCVWVNLLVRGEHATLEAMRNALFLFGVLSIAGLYIFEYFRKSWFTDSQKKKVAEWYSERWLGLWHAEDEAISALKNIKLVKVPIIKDDFLKPLIAMTQVVIMVIIGAYFVRDIWLNDAASLYNVLLIGESEESELATQLTETSFQLEMAYQTASTPEMVAQLDAAKVNLEFATELGYTIEEAELAVQLEATTGLMEQLAATSELLEYASQLAATSEGPEMVAQLATTIEENELASQVAAQLASQLATTIADPELAAQVAEANEEFKTDEAFFFGAIFGSIIILFIFITAGTYVLRFLAWLTGKPLSWILNKILWASVRQEVWGDDLLKEDVRAIRPLPAEFNKNPGPLPESVARPLRMFSEQNAIQTLYNVRRVLGMSDETVTAPELQSNLTESLKWEELIHTSYFKVPEFVDLLAIGLHQTGLVALKQDFAMTPERVQLSEWCKRR